MIMQLRYRVLKSIVFGINSNINSYNYYYIYNLPLPSTDLFGIDFTWWNYIKSKNSDVVFVQPNSSISNFSSGIKIQKLLCD